MKSTPASIPCRLPDKSFQSGRRLRFHSSVIALILLGFPLCLSAADWKAEKQAMEQKIKNQSITINQLQQGLRLQQEKAMEARGQEQDLLAELKVIDAQLLEKLTKLASLEAAMASQQELISTKEKDIQKIQLERQQMQAHLQKRFTAYYKTGTIGMLNVAFSADTLPNLLSIHDSFNAVIDYDQNLLQQYRKTLDGLEQTRKALSLEITLLDTFINQANQEKEAIEQTRQEKNELLAQIQTQTRLHEQAVQAIEKEADKVSAQIATMKQKKEILSQGFFLSKGKLPTPVSGRVLSRYGESRKNRMGVETVSSGLVFEAPDGTRVKAIFEGTIHYAGYMRGHGNTIIIDHGFNFYSVTSRIEKILKNEGDTVAAGEDIGITGETATLMEEGLYFEIRHDTATEDPLLWLDRKKLSLP